MPRHPGDPEKLPKEIVLKRAADLAEALYRSAQYSTNSGMSGLFISGSFLSVLLFMPVFPKIYPFYDHVLSTFYSIESVGL